MTDLQPDPDEVLQVEEPEPTVKVTVEGPTRVQTLPRKSAGIRGRTVDATTPQQLLAADPHRGSATVIAVDEPILIAGSRQEVSGGNPGTLPTGVAVTFHATDELWAMCATAATTTSVTVIQERWADG